jgi:2-hydroxy fatty acid dioxygenase
MAPVANKASPAPRTPRAAAAANANAKHDDAALVSALVSYGEYHHHPVNQLIHLVCVPALLFTLLVALAYLPAPPLPLPLPSAALAASSSFFWPLVATLLYIAYYTLALDCFAGACWSLVIGAPLCLGACVFYEALGPARAWRWAAVVHAASWALQIGPGHALFERRRPALVDSFWQAIATAPLFVFVEAMFAAGWNAPLRAKVERGVKEALRREAERQGRRRQEQQQQQGAPRSTRSRRG